MNSNRFIGESSNASFYDADSSVYDQERWVSPAGSFTNRAQQAIVAELTDGWTGAHLLEVGPGTARFSIPFLRRGNEMTLVDVSEGMLSVASRNIEAAGLARRARDYVKASMYALPFDDDTFDHVVSINVLNHLEEPGKAIRELARVLRAGSTLLINYANRYSYYGLAARRINRRGKAVGREVYSHWSRPGQMSHLIRAAGLRLEAVVGHVHVPQAMEGYTGTLPLIRLLDAASRRGGLRPLAPIQFCLCRKLARM